MKKPKSKQLRIQSRTSEVQEIELLEKWIEFGKPESGSNPLSLPPLPAKSPIGRIDESTYSQYAGCTKFQQLPLSKNTKDGLRQSGYKNMTNIQRASLPHSLSGRDILGAAKTGSGKTLAFIIPVLEKLYKARWGIEDGVGSIIMSPTRELADQIFGVLKSVGKHHGFSAGLLIGGNEYDEEKDRVNRMNILICTPGRLLKHMDTTPNFDCSQLQVLVLDEADRILDAGFKKEVNAIISQLPKHRQTLLFSATQTKSVKDLARLSLKDPEYVAVDEEAIAATPSRLQQKVMLVPLDQKLDMLWSFIKAHLNSRILVFLSSCKQVRFVYEAFKKLRPGIPLKCLHGRMKQIKRTFILQQFVEQRSVLFSTDVSSRGLDFNKGVDWVVQVDCPDDVAGYIHRVGRTARYDSAGRSVLFLLPSEMKMLDRLQEKKIPVQVDKANTKRLQSVSGLLMAETPSHQFQKSSITGDLHLWLFLHTEQQYRTICFQLSSTTQSSIMRTPTNRTVKVIPFQHSYTGGDSTTPATSSSSSSMSRWSAKLNRMKMIDWIELFLPCSRWIRTYNWREYLQPDLVSGVTVGIMLVPQSMSYAKLAGLQPIYGLYTGLVPIFVYCIFGSSRQLAVGPVALVSLLVSNVLGNIDSSGELYTELAILLSLMVGILECTMGLLRLGWLIRFISHSVISGFTTASAIVIALSQAKYFLGYSIVRSSEIIPLVKSIISGADKFSWPPFVMGLTILAIMLTMKQLGKTRKNLRFLRAGGPLTAVVLGTTFVKIFHPSSISLVGDIPQGLPSFSIPKEFAHVKSLIPTTFLITGVAILESVGIAKALAAKNGYELDSNQELFGLGVANIFGSFFSAYPATGSFSRSAVNNESGAKTGLSGFVMGIIICSALLFMTPLFEFIPQCALAAIVVSAVIGLVDYEEAIFLWRVDKKDFFLWTVTSTTTLFFGIEIGVLVGVGFSLAFVIHESANPHIAVLGRLPGTTVYRNIQQYPEAYTYNGIVIVRIDAPLYFANTSFIKDRLREYEIAVDQSGSRRGPEVERIYFLILEMAPVTYADSSAVQALKELYQEYKSRNIQIAIANPNGDVLETLARSGFIDLVGREWCFVRVHDAVQVCLQNVETLISNGLPNKTPPKPSIHNSSSFIQRLKEKRKQDLSSDDMESGETQLILEPLLPHK